MSPRPLPQARRAALLGVVLAILAAVVPPDPFCGWCRSAGLLERSHRRKPAFVAFRTLTGS